MTSSNDFGGLDPARLDELWDFDDPAASERRFRDALDLLSDAGSPGSVQGAELMTQLARALGLQGRFDDAHALLDAVASSTVPVSRPAGRVVAVRVALERGRLLNSSGDPAAAIAHFTEALRTAGAAGQDFLEVDAAHMLAIADSEHSEDWTEQALRVVERSADPRVQRWSGSLHNNAGWARHDTGDYAGALTEFEQAAAAYSVHGTVEQVRIARWAVARALRSLARFDEALQIQQRLAAGGPADGYVEEELAELMLALGEPDEAARHAAVAVDLLTSGGAFAEYEPGRLDRLRRLATTS